MKNKNSLTEGFTSSTPVHHHLLIRPANYPHTLLGFQTKPKEAIIFKGQEISYEQLVVMLDHAEVPKIPEEGILSPLDTDLGRRMQNHLDLLECKKEKDELLAEVKALHADVLTGSNFEDPHALTIEERLAGIIKKYC